MNLFNNQLESIPGSLSSLPKLKSLNLGMNRLNEIPRGFGSFAALEVLDLTYNNLNEKSLPPNFFMICKYLLELQLKIDFYLEYSNFVSMILFLLSHIESPVFRR